jgi:radical SAM protein with 4Fe4S-binding SPASM domain
MMPDAYRVMLAKVPEYVRIDFSGMSEPWANPHCTELLQHTLESGYNITVYTTLYGITVNDAEKIVSLFRNHEKQLEILCLHLPDANGNMRGFKFSDEYDAVLDIFLHFGWGNPRIHFEAMTMDKNAGIHPSLARFAFLLQSKKWEGLTRGGNVDESEVVNPSFEVGGTPHYDTPVTCSFTPFYDQNVLLPNGDVVLCCMDYSTKHKVGNLLEGDYFSIFTSDGMRDLVKENMQNRYSDKSLCRTCTRAKRWRIKNPAKRQFWDAV